MVNCSPSPEPPRLNGAPCEIRATEGQGTSSDSEDEQIISHEGYELLSQQVEDEDASTVSDICATAENQSASEGAGQASVFNPLEDHDPLKAERDERLQLWSGSGGRDETPLDEARTQQVLQAMAGFSLPSSAVPAWASTVPEDQWRARLEERLQAMKQKSSEQ